MLENTTKGLQGTPPAISGSYQAALADPEMKRSLSESQLHAWNETSELSPNAQKYQKQFQELVKR